jgi:hypothetical protein
MAEDFYGSWHTGVTVVPATRRWRGYVAESDSGRREYVDGDFDDRAAAAVAASDLLTRLREEEIVQDGAGLPRI